MRNMGIAIYGNPDNPEVNWNAQDSVTDCRQTTAIVQNQNSGEAWLYYDSQAPNMIRFVIQTGNDDMGGGANGSSARATVFYPGGGKFTCLSGIGMSTLGELVHSYC